MQFTTIEAQVSGDGSNLESQGLISISGKASARGNSKTVDIQNTVSSRQVIPFRGL
jgi:hypothetical protein